MKRLLKNLLVITTIATGSLPVIACSMDSHQQKDNNDYEIAVEINKAKYKLNVNLLSSISEIKKQLTGKFIKSQLNPNLQNLFQDKLLTVGNITYNDSKLTPEDLINTGNITTLLNFHYGTISAVTTLILQIQDQHQEEVIKAIKSNDYEYSNNTDSTLNDLQNTINTDFIKQQLDINIQNWFKSDKFEIQDFLKDNQPLSSSDLKVSGTFFITVNFQYYETNNSFMLKLILNPSINDEVTKAITNTIYSQTITSGTTIGQLTNLITPEFIKMQLLKPFKDNFKESNWTFNQLINKATGKPLKNDELVPIDIVNAEIQFTYNGIDSQAALALNIVQTKDNEIINDISSMTYRVFAINGDLKDPNLFEKTFNANFIANQLPIEVQAKFDKEKYKFIKFDIDEDGFKTNVYQVVKLSFTYEGKAGITQVFLATPFLQMALMTQKNIDVTQGTTVTVLKQKYLESIQETVLGKNPTAQKIKDYQLVLNTFNFKLLGIMNINEDGSIGDNDLTNQDLSQKGSIKRYLVFNIDNSWETLPVTININ